MLDQTLPIQPTPDRSEVDGAVFRRAMRELAGGVSVVTVGRGAERTGFTATSATSLSVDPPTLLICVNRTASSYPAIRRDGHFAVNILDASQRPVADRFAGLGGIAGTARYEGANWSTLATGAPVLADALVTLDCGVDELIERHSHAIVIGRVRAIGLRGGGPALLYWRGEYEQIGWSNEEASLATGIRRG